MSDSPENRKRVRGKIVELIKEFCQIDRTFHMSELNAHIAAGFDGYVAPDSPGRIMRMLKQEGIINYELVSRSQSKYRVVPSPLNTWLHGGRG